MRIAYGSPFMKSSNIRRLRTGLKTARPVDQARVLDTLVSNLDGMAYRCLNDRLWTMVFVSYGCLELTGYGAEELLADGGVSWEELTHPEDRFRVRREIDEAIAADKRFTIQYRIVSRSAQVKQVVERGSGVSDENGQKVLEGFIEDVSVRHKTLEALEQAELRYRHIFEHASEGIFQTTQDGRYLSANPALAKLYGYATANELIADLSDIGRRLYVKESRRQEFHLLMEAHGEITNFESEVYRRDGSKIWISENVHIVRDGSGRFMFYEGTVQDITERKIAENELRIAATAFESHEGLVVTDAQGLILRVNRAFIESTGYTAEEVMGQTTHLLKSDRHNEEFYREMWQTIHRTGRWQGELWDRRKNGEVYPKWLAISAVKDNDGAVTHYVGAHYDISERKKAEEDINALAYFDQLTGLANRTLLADRMKQTMAASSRSDNYCALLFIDLDNFKTLNDTLGHDIGDALLRQVAQRLTLSVREGDTVARLGGDEFIVLLAGLSASENDAATDIEAVAEKILASFNQTYHLGELAHHSTASIGATLFKGDRVSNDDLMKQADLAMYRAKAAGRNSIRFFDPTLEAAVQERSAMDKDLRLALQEQQFLLYYQGQIDADDRCTGAEALVRWQHPQRGMVSPADFIPLAEETGLILPLGHWVMATACAQLAAWAARPEMVHLTVAVNVSALQFHQADFVDQVLSVLKNTGANPQRLKLELTESLLVANVEDVITKMRVLKRIGVGFSLDDFGTGYSSLSYLSRLPLDQLKIDRSFVMNIESVDSAAVICAATISLAHNLNLKVVAEGVETDAQRYFLSTVHRCDLIQGYLVSRPLAVAEFEAFAQHPTHQYRIATHQTVA